MKKLFIGICENSAEDAKILIQYLEISKTALDIDFEIHVSSTGTEFLATYLPIYDIVFLTIPTYDMDTKEFIFNLRNYDSNVRIILISYTNELFQIGYEYTAKNYLLKPLKYFNILDELKSLLTDEQTFHRPSVWISSQKGEYKLYLHKLRYIETASRQLIFHYQNETLVVYGKMSDFENKLCNHNFFRCNNSYIVNINYIESIQKELNRYVIFLITGEKIPLSRNKKKELVEIIREIH